MKEIIWVMLAGGLAFPIGSLFCSERAVMIEMQEKIIDANFEMEERGYQVRMQRERILREAERRAVAK